MIPPLSGPNIPVNSPKDFEGQLTATGRNQALSNCQLKPAINALLQKSTSSGGLEDITFVSHRLYRVNQRLTQGWSQENVNGLRSEADVELAVRSMGHHANYYLRDEIWHGECTFGRAPVIFQVSKGFCGEFFFVSTAACVLSIFTATLTWAAVIICIGIVF